MKHIHAPTLIMHLMLILLAALTINDYPDFFLGISSVVLCLHLIWALRSKRGFFITHALGCALYALARISGLVVADNGFMGLGGGEYALFIYEIALGISLILIAIVSLFKARNR